MISIEGITTLIYGDPWYRGRVKKMLEKNGRKVGYNNTVYVDDLYHELILIILENKDSVIDSYSKNKLRGYWNTLLFNQVESKTSPFYLKYRRRAIMNVEIPFDMDIEESDSEIYKPNFDIKKYCDDHKLLDWYESEIFNLYFRINSSFMVDDISEKVSYKRIAKELNSTYDRVFRRLSIIKFKIFWSIINNEDIKNEIKFGDEKGGLIYMMDFIDKFKKRNDNYDKWIK